MLDRFFGVMERMSWPLATLAWAVILFSCVMLLAALGIFVVWLFKDASPLVFMIVLPLISGGILASVIRE